MVVSLVGDAPVISAQCAPAALLAHARRTAELTRAVSMATRLTRPSERRAVGDILILGIALSQCVDLGIIGGGSANWRDLNPVAFPAGNRANRFREAIRADTPRYEAPWARGRCPISGPRGGACRERHAQPRKWVTDLTTGAWEYRDICATHEGIAFARHRDSPEPPPNRGGVLAAAFPEYDIDATYAYVTPTWDPAIGIPAMGDVRRPKLRVVAGGVA